MGDFDDRLARMESELASIKSLLEQIAKPAAARPTPAVPPQAPEGVVATAGRAASRALRDAYGQGEVETRLAELFVRLAEPETLESLGRIGTLLPQVEYAFQALAAGPELLDQGMAMFHDKLRERGTEPFEVERRAQTALDLFQEVSRPEVLRALGQLTQVAPAVSPAVQGAAQALGARARAEGSDPLAARVESAVLTLTDEETLGALTRIAALAPNLEYAVNAVAAAPDLIDEGTALAKTWAKANGVDGEDIERRLKVIVGALNQLTEPQSMATVMNLAVKLPVLAPKLEQILALTERLDLDSIVAVASTVNIPKAAQLIAMVERLDYRALTELFTISARPEVTQGISALLTLTDQLARFVEALPVQDRTLAMLENLNQAIEAAASDPPEIGLWGLVGAFRQTEVRRAAGFGVEVAKRIGQSFNGHDHNALPRET